LSRRTSSVAGSRGWIARAAALVLLSSVPGACERNTLPSPPAPLTRGVVIFQDANFGGAAAHVTGDLASLRGYGSPCVETADTGDDPYFSVGSRTWSNCISSVRVAPGWQAVLYAGNNFTGGHVEVTGDVPDLRDVPGGCADNFNDCVSSIRVSRR
jgi:hypothetical protein